MKKFLGWLGGILAAVIATVLGWYFTRPPQTTTFQGMVINREASAPVSGAMVSIELSGAPNNQPFHDFTDGNGSYRLDFTNLSKSTTAKIEVTAKGFEVPRPASITSVTMQNRLDFEMTPLPSAGPPPPPPPGGLTHLPLNARPAFIPKVVSQGAIFRLPAGR
jgi:hypothetical protein